MSKRIDPLGLVLLLFGLGNVSNALWMLRSPVNWYLNVPASVPDFGPLNEHFVRDLGAMFLVAGTLLLYSAFHASWRKSAVALNLGWYAVHSFIHVYDTLRGAVQPVHFLIDLPLVYFPTVLLAGLAFLVRSSRDRA
jgi:hypothetical protein